MEEKEKEEEEKEKEEGMRAGKSSFFFSKHFHTQILARSLTKW